MWEAEQCRGAFNLVDDSGLNSRETRKELRPLGVWDCLP